MLRSFANTAFVACLKVILDYNRNEKIVCNTMASVAFGDKDVGIHKNSKTTGGLFSAIFLGDFW